MLPGMSYVELDDDGNVKFMAGACKAGLFRNPNAVARSKPPTATVTRSSLAGSNGSPNPRYSVRKGFYEV